MKWNCPQIFFEEDSYFGEALGKEALAFFLCLSLSLFKYLFIWLQQVLVAAHGI